MLQFLRERLRHVARPMGTHRRRLRLRIQHVQQHAADQLWCKGVEIGPDHRQPHGRTHQRIESRQTVLDDGHHRLLQTRGFDKARHLGVVDQRQAELVEFDRCPLYRLHAGLSQRHVDGVVQAGGEIHAQGMPLFKSGLRVGQLPTQWHRRRVALGQLQSFDRHGQAAIEHGRREKKQFLPRALDQRTGRMDGLHDRRRTSVLISLRKHRKFRVALLIPPGTGPSAWVKCGCALGRTHRPPAPAGPWPSGWSSPPSR